MNSDPIANPLQVRNRAMLPSDLGDEDLRIVVFGPGRGEAVVVLLPDGRVGIIDGCREPLGVGVDPVSTFLRELEATRGRFNLAFVCLTHPHDDHYAGLGRLLAAYERRVKEVWSVMMVSGRFSKALSWWVGEVAATGKYPDASKSKGVERVVAAFEAARREFGATLRILAHNMTLWEQTDCAGADLVVESCGPSAADQMDALLQLTAYLESKRARKLGAPPDPNLTSGAIVIRWGDAGVLLGGDLLVGNSDQSGWRSTHGQVKPPIQVFNLSHHASENAHHSGLWDKLKADLRLGIVTPFKNAITAASGGGHPPRPDHINALASEAVIAITARPHWVPGFAGLPVPTFGVPWPAHAKGMPVSKGGFFQPWPTGGAKASQNAVGFTLDRDGNVTKVVLAGEADYYAPV